MVVVGKKFMVDIPLLEEITRLLGVGQCIRRKKRSLENDIRIFFARKEPMVKTPQ